MEETENYQIMQTMTLTFWNIDNCRSQIVHLSLAFFHNEIAVEKCIK